MFRTLSDRTTSVLSISLLLSIVFLPKFLPTFIFPYVFQSKGQAGILPLDYSHFAESAFADHSKEAEMVEVHYAISCVSRFLGLVHDFHRKPYAGL